MANITDIIKNNRGEMITLVTHKAPHHCDEVAATALLHILFDKMFGFASYTQIRTFTPADDGYTDDTPNCIVYDIGLGKYDHHQVSPNDKHCLRHDKDGVVRKYSSVGLIWNEIGEYLVPKEYVNEVYNKFIRYIDDNDNGFEVNPLSWSISMLNITNGADFVNDAAFFGAVNILKELFLGIFNSFALMKKEEDTVNKAIEETKLNHKCYVFTENFCKSALNKLAVNSIPFYIYASGRGDNCYVFRTITPIGGMMNEHIVDIPDEVRNWEGVTFLHPTCFLGSAISKERAIQVVETILNTQEIKY